MATKDEMLNRSDVPDVAAMERQRAEKATKTSQDEQRRQQLVTQGREFAEDAIATAMMFAPIGKAEAVREAGTSLLKAGPGLWGKLKPMLPQAVQDALPMSARDLLHLMFLPQNPSPVRLAKFEMLKAGEDLVRATKMQMAAVPYAWATYGGGAALAAKSVAKVLAGNDSDKQHFDLDDKAGMPAERNARLAYVFEHTVDTSNLTYKREVLQRYPELVPAFDLYSREARHSERYSSVEKREEVGQHNLKLIDDIAAKIGQGKLTALELAGEHALHSANRASIGCRLVENITQTCGAENVPVVLAYMAAKVEAAEQLHELNSEPILA